MVLLFKTAGFTLQFQAFLDHGSQAAFASDNGLANARISEASSSVLLSFRSRVEPQAKYNVTVHVLPRVSKHMPSLPCGS